MRFYKPQVNYLIHNRWYGFYFDNPKSGQFKQTKNAHSYEHGIHPTWTLIKAIVKDVNIGPNATHIIARMWIPIQLAITHTIDWTQRLTFDYLTFDPIGPLNMV